MGLIEVLIAVVVLSFGMLGLAGLQMWSLKSNQSSLERGMVVVQTHSIVDAMHADRTAALDHQFDIAMGAVPAGSSFAATSLRTWRANVRDALGPDATGSVACNGPVCTVTIRWNDQRGTASDVEEEIEAAAAREIVTVVRL